jgi:hypothetical protein
MNVRELLKHCERTVFIEGGPLKQDDKEEYVLYHLLWHSPFLPMSVFIDFI